MNRRAIRLLAASLPVIAVMGLGVPVVAQSTPAPLPATEIARQAEAAQRQLRQTFTNLMFEDFAPSPVEGPIYQANAGGRIVYYAPKSEHLLFAAVYDRNGVNLTALAQEAAATKRLKRIDPSQALAIGPPDAPMVIEFTDPDGFVA